MKRNDFREQAEDLLSDYGAQYRIEGDMITWWFEADKKTTAKLPQHGGDYRGLRNSAAKWRKDLEAARPAHFVLQQQSDEDKDKWKSYLDKRLHDIKTEFEAKFETIKGDISASTDIALDAGLKVDGFMKVFQGAFSGQQPTTVTISPPAQQPVVEQPKIAIAPSLPKLQTAPAPIEKGLDALERLKAKQWAEVIEEIDDPETGFDLSDLDGRILYFLYKCGPQTPHDLKVAGVWRAVDSVTRFLENMEAEGLVRFLKAEKRWAITDEGIRSLDDDSEPELAMHTPPVTVAQKPALTIVPSGPRILKPVETEKSRTAPSGLSVKDELLIYLYWNEQDGVPAKTTAELMRVSPPLRGYGHDCRDIGTTASMAKTTGHLTQEYRGGPWLLTKLGREQAKRKLGDSRIAS